MADRPKTTPVVSREGAPGDTQAGLPLTRDTQTTPDGFVLVPVQPTRRMLTRGLERADINWREASADEALSDDEVARIWRAMVAAAQEEANG